MMVGAKDRHPPDFMISAPGALGGHQAWASHEPREAARASKEYGVERGVEEKLGDPKLMVADTTAQEAAIPWPNEMGLMASFLSSVAAASKKAGTALKHFAQKMVDKFKAGREKVRKYRLFAKTKKARLQVMGEMAKLVGEVQTQL